MSLLHAIRCGICLCLVLPATAQARVQAIGGEPFGVCLVQDSADSARPSSLADLEDALLDTVTEAKGRALYPVAQGRGSALFLFKGDQPLDLASGQRVPVLRDEAAHRELLKAWWEAYQRQAKQVVSKDAYEPIVETYLTAMLSRRLGLDASGMDYWRPWKNASVDEVVGLLLGTESIRLAMQRHTLLADGRGPEKADQPLPEAAAPPVMPIPAFDEGKVIVEPLALRVPKECFYLRSGSFQDFVWLRRMLDEWGGEFRNLLATRGADYGIRGRLERQLALRETDLSRRFGGLVVGEVALIGTDTFFREGSAIGIIFHAKHSQVLARHLQELRRQAQAEDPAVSVSNTKIGDREVSLLSRSDHAVRSFYLVDGDFHLVTNSRWIAERFLETARNPETSLGGLKEFRYARSRVPLTRMDPAFLYLSDPFFRNLVGPAYRVEMTRRAQSLAELSVAGVARLAARAEGGTDPEPSQLIQGGFLPPGFGARADGSALAFREGGYVDTLRGGRGTFLPVPDVAIPGITPSEVEAYRHFARTYARLWTSMDPVFGAITRKPAAKGWERVALELHISPYAKSKYGPLETFLGPASPWRLGDVKGDLVSAEAVLRPRDEAEAVRQPKDLTRLFAGVRDFTIPVRLQAGEVVPDRTWGKVFETNLRGYLGQYKPAEGGITAFLFRSLGDKPDAKGYVKQRGPGGPDGLWMRTFGDFVVSGLDRKTLETVTPQLKLQKADRPAQVRLAWGDLGATHLGAFLNAHLYARDRRTSAANALLLQSLVQQLHTAPQEALATAEGLLDQRIVCPLGGAYVLDPSARWISTAWVEKRLRLVDEVPTGYRHPSLDWIHGTALEFSIDPQSLQTRLELLIDPRKRPAASLHK